MSNTAPFNRPSSHLWALVLFHVRQKHPNMEQGTPKDGTLDTIEIDAAGDLWLEMDSRKLLVSSKILSLASPVFNAMLNSKFREGQNATSGPRTITLPDDDVDAMTVVCHALHHMTHRVPVHLISTKLNTLAILCDKYGCVQAMKPWSRTWLSPIVHVDDVVPKRY